MSDSFSESVPLGEEIELNGDNMLPVVANIPTKQKAGVSKMSFARLACKVVCFAVGLIAVIGLSFLAGFWLSWLIKKPSSSTMSGDDNSWVQSRTYDQTPKSYNTVWRIGNSERQVISSTPSTQSEGSKRFVQLPSEEIGYRQLIKDPNTQKVLYSVDVEYVTDIPFGGVTDGEGDSSEKKLRITVIGGNNRLEIVPMSASHVEEEDAVETDSIDTLAPSSTFFVEWNNKWKGMIQNSTEEMNFNFPENSGEGKKVQKFFEDFMEHYKNALEAEAQLKLDEETEQLPEDLSDDTEMKKSIVSVGGKKWTSYYRKRNCWVRCRAGRFRRWGRRGLFGFSCSLMRGIPKRCYKCLSRKKTCHGIASNDPKVCSGNGQCHAGKCKCARGWAGSKCNRCHSRYTGATCKHCKKRFSGPMCRRCAPGYWGFFCWFKIKCFGKSFDDPNVCSGKGACTRCNRCSCQRGFAGRKCEKCAPNFTGANCDKCIEGYTGAHCNKKISCGGKTFDDPAVCSSNGKCLASGCQCKAGFEGVLCEKKILKCHGKLATDPQVCGGKGTCVSQDTCQCQEGYSGNACQTVRKCGGVEFSSGSVCSGNGNCDKGDGANGVCTCRPEWTGATCGQCQSAKHDANQGCKKCLSTFTNYPSCDKCSNAKQQAPACSGCVAGNTGYPACDQCANGFFDNAGTCTACNCDSEGSTGASCDGSGQCVCKEGFSGKHCTACESDYYKDPNGICKACSCNTEGTIGNDKSCDSNGSCSCQDGFSGAKCDTPRMCGGVRFDAQGVCNGNGQCSSGVGANGVCTCNSQYGSSDCSAPICFGKLSSDHEVCSGHGTCTAPGTCACQAGFVGQDCSQILQCNGKDYNDPTVCSGAGSCTSSGCVCNAGRIGSNCEGFTCFSTPSTDSSVCSSNGKCTALDTCQCNAGYSGQQCEVERTCQGVSFTHAAVCSSHGTCVGQDNCQCDAGYQGQNCDQCAANYFENNGACLNCDCDPDGSVSSECSNSGACTCKLGYSGAKCSACSADHYEDQSGVCQQCGCHSEGTINGDLSCSSTGQCQCKAEFSGLTCSVKRTCNGVDFDAANVCSGNGQCLSHGCECNAGFSGANCEYKTCFGKVETASDVCSGNGQCTGVDQCQCNTGFSGSDCSVILKCNNVNFNDASVCNGQGTCTGTGNSGTCQCSEKFTGPNCQECSNSKHTGAGCDQCQASFTNYPSCDQCSNSRKVAPDCQTCQTGYTGTECDLCATSYFDSQGSCLACNCDAEGSQSTSCDANGQCQCKSGYSGTKCTACSADHYEKDGVCTACNCATTGTVNGDQSCSASGQCQCKAEFSGLTCSVKRTCNGVDFDAANVCGGHGTCTGQDQCSCFSGFTGSNCDVPICYGIPATDSTVCGGNGQCSAEPGIPTCVCNANFFGEECTQKKQCANVDFDSPAVCGGNGQCVGETEVGTCQCEANKWTGATCTVPMCFGDSGETACNGASGTCSSPDTCVCATGFSGAQCESKLQCNGVDFDAANVCGGHGTCTTSGCVCEQGFELKDGTCQSASVQCFGLDQNDANVCSGRGTCVSQDLCSCQATVGGTNCQDLIRWGDGTLIAKSTFDFSPKFIMGSELTDSNAVYSIKVRIDALANFPGSRGVSLGLAKAPAPNLFHDLGALEDEWGYVSTGQKFSNNIQENMGSTYEQGDTVLIEYDAPQKTVTFALQKAGQSTFVPQSTSPAFTNVFIDESGKTLNFGLSVTCFGSCEFQLI